MGSNCVDSRAGDGSGDPGLGSGSIKKSFPHRGSHSAPPITWASVYPTYLKENEVKKSVEGSVPGKRYFLPNYGLGPLLPALALLLGFASLPVFLMLRFPLSFCFNSDSGGQDYVETVIPSKQLPSAAFFSETQRQFSRYFIEFEELQLLGKGAFGAVIKVWLQSCAQAL